MKKLLAIFSFFALCALHFALPVDAHAFGQQYTLPLPAWLYMYGGATTVLLSFVLAGIFIKPRTKKVTGDRSQRSFLIPHLPLAISYMLFAILKTFSVFFLLLSIVSGFIGVDIGVLNINMTYFWIFLVIGGAYFSAVFGQWWNVLNPWMSIINTAEKLMQDSLTGIFPYPRQLSYLPSVVFAFLLIVFELIFQTTPFTLSLLLFTYTTITLSGMILFGKEAWTTHAEFFTVYFNLMAKLSPFSVKNSRLSFHLPGFHILKSPLTSSHLLIFILILLAGTAFDGFKETTHWFSLYYSFLHTFEFLFPLFTYQFIQLASYVILVLLFVGLYFLAIWLTHLLTKTSSIKSLALSYAGTLIPILLGYNIAHYFSLVLIQGQTIIPLISDPFGFGWNLLGTANFKPNITILSLTTIWHLQVAAIILGHILAVILTHFIGLNAKVPRKQFILSQIPLLILMIFYTMGGLWLLSLPLN